MSGINIPKIGYYTNPTVPVSLQTNGMYFSGSLITAVGSDGMNRLSTGGSAATSNPTNIAGLERLLETAGNASPVSDEYTICDQNETITGNWNFTGDFLHNGGNIAADDIYFYEENDITLTGSGIKDIAVTHGLGTDNVFVTLYISTNKTGTTRQFTTAAARPDGHMFAMGGYWSQSVNSQPPLPTTGIVNARIYNSYFGIQTFGIKVIVTKA